MRSGVVAGLRPEQCGFQLTRIADASAAAEAFDLILVDGEDFDDGEIDRRHSASFL